VAQEQEHADVKQALSISGTQSLKKEQIGSASSHLTFIMFCVPLKSEEGTALIAQMPCHPAA
jgi:hypothetical protein